MMLCSVVFVLLINFATLDTYLQLNMRQVKTNIENVFALNRNGLFAVAWAISRETFLLRISDSESVQLIIEECFIALICHEVFKVFVLGF